MVPAPLSDDLGDVQAAVYDQEVPSGEVTLPSDSLGELIDLCGACNYVQHLDHVMSDPEITRSGINVVRGLHYQVISHGANSKTRTISTDRFRLAWCRR